MELPAEGDYLLLRGLLERYLVGVTMRVVEVVDVSKGWWVLSLAVELSRHRQWLPHSPQLRSEPILAVQLTTQRKPKIDFPRFQVKLDPYVRAHTNNY